MIYRVQDEIYRKLNRMEAPEPKFKNVIPEKANLQISVENIKALQKDAFEAGYNQAIKELKQFFGVK